MHKSKDWTPAPKVGKPIRSEALPLKRYAPRGLLSQVVCLPSLKCKTVTQQTGSRFFCLAFLCYRLMWFPVLLCCSEQRASSFPFTAAFCFNPFLRVERVVCELKSRQWEMTCPGSTFLLTLNTQPTLHGGQKSWLCGTLSSPDSPRVSHSSFPTHKLMGTEVKSLLETEFTSPSLWGSLLTALSPLPHKAEFMLDAVFKIKQHIV